MTRSPESSSLNTQFCTAGSYALARASPAHRLARLRSRSRAQEAGDAAPRPLRRSAGRRCGSRTLGLAKLASQPELAKHLFATGLELDDVGVHGLSSLRCLMTMHRA